MQPGAEGPEALRTRLARMNPAEFGMPATGDAATLARFQLSVLTEGSGTQLFSTTFVQWTVRETLRRAQPLTLIARFTPRVREQSMKDVISGSPQTAALDPAGSLIDADIGAYYTWINQQRLPGAERASFLACFENHREAIAIGPAFERGREDAKPIDMQGLLLRATS